MQKVYSLLRKNIKWRAVSLIFMAVQSNAFAAAQDSSNVSLNFTNQPIENVFIALEKQTGYTVFFSGSTLDGNTPITVKVSQVTLSNALAAVLRGKNITWTIKHKGIVLSKRPVAAEAPAEPVNAALADTVPLINVSGVVVDAKGNPIPAATVSLKGYPRGQGTDNMGRFSFTRVPGNGTLVFSSLGYDPKQVRIGGRAEIRVALDSAIRDIQGVEVVSTGYQNIPKERATGSFVQLNNQLINRNPSTDILDRILNITSSLKYEPISAGAGAGNGTNISIRGFSTINANMKPLIVIDGFAYEDLSNISSTQLRNNPLNSINPNDIESITILRDAAAASIWGTRSGNGVIVITTKKGTFNQKTRVQFTSNLSISEKPNLKALPIIPSSEMIEFERNRFKAGVYNIFDDLYPSTNYYPQLPLSIEILLKARRNEISNAEAEAQLSALAVHDVRDDITKYMLQNEINQQYNLSLSGGNEKISYYASIGYDINRLSSIGDNRKRFTLRFDNTFKPLRQLEISTYIAYTNSYNNNNGFNYQSLLANGSQMASPYARLIDNTGNFLHVPNASTYRTAYIDTLSLPGILNWHYRPLEEMRYSNNINKYLTNRIGGNIRYKISSFLNVELKGQYEKGYDNYINHVNINRYETRNSINQYMYTNTSGLPVYPFPLGGILYTTNDEKSAWNLRGQINVNKRWDRHQITGILGSEFGETKLNSNQDTKYGYDANKLTFSTNMDFNSLFPTRPSGSSRIFNFENMSGTLDRNVSYFGNAGYTLDNKYTVTISGRIDASNFLGAKAIQRRVPLYSTGASWDISKESFYHINWMPNLKLRGTFGYNGNTNNKITSLATARYATDASAGFGLHNEPILTLLSAPNPGLTWEKIKVINLGMDFGMFKNRIEASLEYYSKKGLNLIGEIVTEASTGVRSYTGNYASMKNRGVDVTINSLNVKQGIVWRSLFNISHNTDKVTEYYITDINKNNPASYMTTSNIAIGKPLIKIYAYPFAGLDASKGDPLGWLNNTPTGFRDVIRGIKPDSLKYFGPATPQIFGSLLNSFTYKIFTLSFNISYKFKYYLRRESINYSNLFSNWGGHADYLNRWTKPGDENNTTVPSLPTSSNRNREDFYRFSDILVIKGDHIRLQDLRLTVDISKSIFPNLPLENIQLNLLASNLGILWKANEYDIDPDLPSPRIPSPKNISFGLNISF